MIVPRTLAVAAALCITWGTAHAGAVPDFKTTAHTVAIVSTLGDVIVTGSRGVQVPDPGLDVVVEQLMAAQIVADLPAAQVVAVGGSRRLWRKTLYKTVGFGDVGMTQMRADLKDWAAAHAADYIVVLRKGTGYPFPKSFDKFQFTGIGLALNSSYASPNGLEPVALLNITVLDGKTLEVVTDLSLRSVDWGSIHYPRTTLTEDESQTLIADTRAMLTSVVPGLVHGVGL